MEKSRNFQIIYLGHTFTQTFQNKPTDQAGAITNWEWDSPAATLSHWGQASSRKQSECGRHGFSNILKLQATLLYSIYHQRAAKTSLFHMRGGRFHAGNTLCALKSLGRGNNGERWGLNGGEGHLPGYSAFREETALHVCHVIE